MKNMEENCEMIWNIWKKGKLNSDKRWIIWKKGMLNSEKIKIKYGRNPSWIVKRYGKYKRKLWNDKENMEEK
jgi:hypothetical protein